MLSTLNNTPVLLDEQQPAASVSDARTKIMSFMSDWDYASYLDLQSKFGGAELAKDFVYLAISQLVAENQLVRLGGSCYALPSYSALLCLPISA